MTESSAAARPFARAKKTALVARAPRAGNPETLPTPLGLHSEVAPCVDLSFIEAEAHASAQLEKRLAQIRGPEAPSNRAFLQIAYDTVRSTRRSCPGFYAPSTISPRAEKHCETLTEGCGRTSQRSAALRGVRAGLACAPPSCSRLAKRLRSSSSGAAGASTWRSCPTRSRVSRSNAPAGASSFRRSSLGGAL